MASSAPPELANDKMLNWLLSDDTELWEELEGDDEEVTVESVKGIELEKKSIVESGEDHYHYFDNKPLDNVEHSTETINNSRKESIPHYEGLSISDEPSKERKSSSLESESISDKKIVKSPRKKMPHTSGIAEFSKDRKEKHEKSKKKERERKMFSRDSPLTWSASKSLSDSLLEDRNFPELKGNIWHPPPVLSLSKAELQTLVNTNILRKWEWPWDGTRIIMICVDSTNASRLAFKAMWDDLREKDNVILCHVRPTPFVAQKLSKVNKEALRSQYEMWKRGVKIVKLYAEALHHAKINTCVTMPCDHDPRKMVCHMTKRYNVHILYVGHHKPHERGAEEFRPHMRRFSKYVRKHAGCRVRVVKARK